MSKIKVDFYLTGSEVNLDSITQALGIIPTKIRKKNEYPFKSQEAGMALDLWQLSTGKEECKAVSLQVDMLQKVLSQKVQIINKLCEEYMLEASVTVVIEMEAGDGPEIVLTKENINFLSSLNAEIGFDLYID